MLKKPLFPRSPREDGDIKSLQKWAVQNSKAMESFVADLMNQVNWPVIDAAPTETPDRIPCIKLYVNGSDYRLYIFYDGSWKYVTLT